VYDVPSLRESARAMKAMSAVHRVFFAIKANPNPEILKIFYEENIGNVNTITQGVTVNSRV
jgi:diaminopimelate decarboxylase/aspartate kinase